MPEISRFFGIIIRMFHDKHNPPNFHAEYAGEKAGFDFRGNIIKGDLKSRTATRLVREWIDMQFLLNNCYKSAIVWGWLAGDFGLVKIHGLCSAIPGFWVPPIPGGMTGVMNFCAIA
uniref:DUF4160 domain-containing protein n=1 Tax=Candidatus Kentrum sp. LFY TaxID=2126342 RepID=A0A450X1J4_9GAMM|nr:MAG: protein of unknown function (DUF4160) [Candidatus Kentron sp. LFY]